MTETLQLHFDTSVKVTVVQRIKEFALIFSQMLGPVWVKFSILPQPVCLTKIMVNFFAWLVFEGENCT